MTLEKGSTAVHRHTGDAQLIERQWYVLSSHGIVLLYISLHPDSTIRDIAEALFLTRRTIWGIIGDLRKAGMIHVRKEGRRKTVGVKERKKVRIMEEKKEGKKKGKKHTKKTSRKGGKKDR